MTSVTSSADSASRPAGPNVAARSARPGPPRHVWVTLAPLILALIVWVFGPALVSGILSFTDWDLVAPAPEPVGFDNYIAVLTDDEFLVSAWQTVVYAIVLLPASTIIPLVLALMIWFGPARAAVVYRGLLFVPMILPPVAVVLTWQFLLNPLSGPLASVFAGAGLRFPDLLGDPATALPTIALIAAPRVIAFTMLLLLAALSTVDRRLVDAGRLEGATTMQIVRWIVLPRIRGTVIVLTALSAVLAGQWVFTAVNELTSGGPDGSTDSVYQYIYRIGFGYFDIGGASAAAMVVLIIVVLVGILVDRAQRRMTRA